MYRKESSSPNSSPLFAGSLLPGESPCQNRASRLFGDPSSKGSGSRFSPLDSSSPLSNPFPKGHDFLRRRSFLESIPLFRTQARILSYSREKEIALNLSNLQK